MERQLQKDPDHRPLVIANPDSDGIGCFRSITEHVARRCYAEDEQPSFIAHAHDLRGCLTAAFEKARHPDLRVLRIEDQPRVRCMMSSRLIDPEEVHFCLGAVTDRTGNRRVVAVDLTVRNDVQRREVAAEIDLVLGVVVRREILGVDAGCTVMPHKIQQLRK